jgi:predicted aspartyl protease
MQMVVLLPVFHLVRSCKMENVTFIEIEAIGGLQVHAIIDNGDESFTSMPKSVYDEMIANQELNKSTL